MRTFIGNLRYTSVDNTYFFFFLIIPEGRKSLARYCFQTPIVVHCLRYLFTTVVCSMHVFQKSLSNVRTVRRLACGPPLIQRFSRRPYQYALPISSLNTKVVAHRIQVLANCFHHNGRTGPRVRAKFNSRNYCSSPLLTRVVLVEINLKIFK